MSEPIVNFKRVKSAGGKDLWVKATVKPEKSVTLLILSDSAARQCVLDANDFTEMATSLRLEESKVWEWAREAFDGPDTSPDHVLTLASDGRLDWRREGNSKIKLKVASQPTSEVDFAEASREFIGELIVQNGGLKRGMSDLTGRHNTLMGDLKECRRKMGEMARAKADAETQLYERFLPILQAKQDKIAELMMTNKTEVKEEEENGDDDDYGSGTDVDEDSATPNKKPKMDTSANSSSLDDSQNFLNTKF